MIDQLMDAWQAQLKSPMTSQFIAQLRPFSGVGFGPRSGDCAQFSFGWKLPRCGSATGRLRFRCGLIRVLERWRRGTAPHDRIDSGRHLTYYRHRVSGVCSVEDWFAGRSQGRPFCVQARPRIDEEQPEDIERHRKDARKDDSTNSVTA